MWNLGILGSKILCVVQNPICVIFGGGVYILFFYFYAVDVEPRDFGVENPMCGPKSYMCNFLYILFSKFFL